MKKIYIEYKYDGYCKVNFGPLNDIMCFNMPLRLTFMSKGLTGTKGRIDHAMSYWIKKILKDV